MIVLLWHLVGPVGAADGKEVGGALVDAEAGVGALVGASLTLSLGRNGINV